MNPRIPVCLVLVVAFAAGGCTPSKPPAAQPVFYPPAPAPPRLQFLTSFNSAKPWVQRQSSLMEFVAGDKTAAPGDITSPYGLAVKDGRIYICDLGVPCVHVIDLPGRKYSRLGEGRLKNPVNITIGPDGTRYVCDTHQRQVAVFNAQDQFVRYLGDPKTCAPIDLAVRGSELLVLDVAEAQIEVWDANGKETGILASKGAGPGQLRMPTNIAVGQDGRMYVADTGTSVVNVYDRQGRFLRIIGAPGDRPGFFARPKGVAIDPQQRLYVADSQWDVIQLFNSDGRLLVFFGGASLNPEGTGNPAGLAIDTSTLEYFRRYVADDFRPEYLLFVANQFGIHKIGVYAFGQSVTPGKRPEDLPASQPVATQPSATRPATAPAPAATQPSGAP